MTPEHGRLPPGPQRDSVVHHGFCANVLWELCFQVKSLATAPAVLLLGFKHSRFREVQKGMSVLWSSRVVMWLEYFWEAGEGYSCCVTLSNRLPSLGLKDWSKFSSEPLPMYAGSPRAAVKWEGSCGHSDLGSSPCLPPARDP